MAKAQQVKAIFNTEKKIGTTFQNQNENCHTSYIGQTDIIIQTRRKERTKLAPLLNKSPVLDRHIRKSNRIRLSTQQPKNER